MSQRRPIYLDLTRIYMPVTAIVSILHRVSGVLLFAALPLLLAGLQALVSSQRSYEALVAWLEKPWAKLFLVLLAFLFAAHLAAGTRHLFLDIGIGIRRAAARRGAGFVLLFSIAMVAFTVFALW